MKKGKRKSYNMSWPSSIDLFSDPTAWVLLTEIQLLGVGLWICSETAQRVTREKLLTRAVSRINFSTGLQTLKHTFKLFPSKEYSGTHACTCWTTFCILTYFHVHAVFIPLVQTFSKIRSMAPSNLSGVSISSSIICWVKVWNFWGVSLFRILLTLRNNS